MLSLEDPTGKKTSVQMLFYSGLLFISSIAVFIIGQLSLVYLVSAVILGMGFLAVISLFFWKISIENAHKVFLASIIYLPVLISIIILDTIIY